MVMRLKYIERVLKKVFSSCCWDVTLLQELIGSGSDVSSLRRIHMVQFDIPLAPRCDRSSLRIDGVSSLLGLPAFMGCIVCVGYFTQTVLYTTDPTMDSLKSEASLSLTTIHKGNSCCILI